MRGSDVAAPTGTAAVTFGVDGETGRYEFTGRTESIQPGICGRMCYAV